MIDVKYDIFCGYCFHLISLDDDLALCVFEVLLIFESDNDYRKRLILCKHDVIAINILIVFRCNGIWFLIADSL